MYLSSSITQEGIGRHEMLGYLPFHIEMTDRLQNFGYVRVEMDFAEGTMKTKGHEFHHTRVWEGRDSQACYYKLSKERDGKISKTWECGIRKNNTIAGYPHLMFYTVPELTQKLL